MLAPSGSAAERRFAARLGAVAAAGLAARLVYVLALTPNLRGAGDSLFYHGIANALAGGRGFIDPASGTATALHPPLFPLVLAAAAKLGAHSWQSQRVVVSLIGALSVLAVGLLARRTAGERAGVLAAVLAAGYPVLISADASVMSETLFGLLIALTLLIAQACSRRLTLRLAALLGASIGLATLTRGEALALLLLVALPICLAARPRRAGSFALVCAACVLVITPWTIRNLEIFARPVLISTNQGTVLAGANCGDTYGGRDIGSWQIGCIPSAPAADESAAAARYTRTGIDFAGDHAQRLPLVAGARLLRSFELLQPVRQAQHAEGRASGIEVAGALAFFAIAALGIGGVWSLRRRGERVGLLLTPIWLAVLITLAGYGVPRFRHPGDIALCALAGVFLADPRGRGPRPTIEPSQPANSGARRT